MNRILAFLSLLTLFTFLSCDNEPYEFDFEEVIIIDEMEEEDTICDDAITVTNEAALAFSDAINENYSPLCNNYKAALLAQIEACGDDDEVLQSIIDSLGDCMPEVQITCPIATEVADDVADAFDVTTEQFYTQVCNAYKLALQNKITACGDDDGSIQTIIDELGDCSLN